MTTNQRARKRGCAFVAEVDGKRLRFSGPTLKHAERALCVHLRASDFRSFTISDASTGVPVGMKDLRNGGRYRLERAATRIRQPKQLETGAARA